LNAIVEEKGWGVAVRLAILELIVLFATSTASLAGPTTLVCDQKGVAGGYTSDGATTTVDLDETAGLVTVHFPRFTSSFGVVEAHSFGPLPGKFDADSVSFSIPGQNITISRVTGNGVVTQGGITIGETWNCRVGRKQF
jgi:hypothetical protein